MTEAPYRVRLLLLRHGRVANHRGDVPLTDVGRAQGVAAGDWFAREKFQIAGLLSGETVRTRATAAAFAAGYRAASNELKIPEPQVSFALRNPDLYLGGQRINMGEGAATLAALAQGVGVEEVRESSLYSALLDADDRVGFWLESGNVPGDDATDVGRRIDVFARSLGDVPGWRGQTVVAVTHSPVLRAVRLRHWSDYSKEPPFLHGYELVVDHSGGLTLSAFVTNTGDIPATSRPGSEELRS